ncbi:hypothetical protein AWR27_18710 [Spirosoma montaniterrae]|uniref:PKD domain-containing protein n=1 Tax=Spirosoma montaniterrae TaxID=1178516 RepID=A0A1P9X0K7_9BACT|nr:hypothetical protein AWR27_18710 [Spirosoma montaniterrae]
MWVSVWNGSAYVRQATPVVDIREEVGEWNDFGLHSICLDPNFESNGLMYLFYTVDLHHVLNFGTAQYSSTTNQYHNATISRVSRFRVQNTNGTLTANSRTVLVGESATTGIPVTFESHAGGTILFGEDGTLLVSTGDGAHHEGVDVGGRTDTYFQASLNFGMMRSNENVGALRAQMVRSLCGKVLRIDPATGNGVSSNPFYDAANPRSPQSRVWTLGLRNPYRMSLKPNTGSTNPADGNPGTLLIGDVSWYQIEEFHVVDKAGLNCGWPVYEGLDPTISYNGTNVRNLDEPGTPTFESLCVQPTTFADNPNPTLRRFTHSRPALDYSHGTARTRVPAFSGTTPIARLVGSTGAPAGTPFFGKCVIGGVYYTGTQFPAMYRNTYFFTDFSQHWIKNLDLHDEGDHVVHEVRNFAPDNFDPSILDIKMNPRDGSLFYVRIQGTVSRISYGGNQPPVANASSTINYGTSPLSVTFTGSNSVDPEGLPLTYLWDFGDGTTSTSANPVHVFTGTGVRKFTVTLTVRDNANQASLPKQLVVSVNNTPPTVQITNPAQGTLYTMSQATPYTLQANVTDTDQTGMGYEWQVSLEHNNHSHPEPVITTASPTVTISPVGCSPNETYYYLITLTVTDNGGLKATHSVTLYPDCNSASSLVSNVVATPQLNSVRVSWINPTATFNEILVAARPTGGFTDIPIGTSYTADPSYTGNGSPIEGGKVVYKGIGNEVTVTNLNPLVQYYFRVYTRVGGIWNGGVEVSAIPNLPPVAPAIQPPAAATGQSYAYTIPVFTDPENQALVYNLTGLPAWLSYNTTSRQLTGTPTQSASHTLTISATDPGGLITAVPFVIVAGPNQPPTAPTLPVLTAEVNQFFTYTTPAFTDPEGKSLTYSVTNLPGWLSFNSGTRQFSGTPTVASSYSITVRATDPSGLFTSRVLVINTSVNQPPIPPTIGPQTAEIGYFFTYTVPAFTDPEGQTLTYSASGLPGWLSFDAVNRRLTGTPTQAGSFTVTVRATDPRSLTASVQVVISTGVCSMVTVKNGSWDDPTVWSCNRVPASTDAVRVEHVISLPNNYTALARRVTFAGGKTLSVGDGARLQFSP